MIVAILDHARACSARSSPRSCCTRASTAPTPSGPPPSRITGREVMVPLDAELGGTPPLARRSRPRARSSVEPDRDRADPPGHGRPASRRVGDHRLPAHRQPPLGGDVVPRRTTCSSSRRSATRSPSPSRTATSSVRCRSCRGSRSSSGSRRTTTRSPGSPTAACSSSASPSAWVSRRGRRRVLATRNADAGRPVP